MTEVEPGTQADASAPLDEAPADEAETRRHLLDRSNRAFAPIAKVFVQNPDKTLSNRAGALASFVNSGDLRALRALLLLHALISNGDGDNGWSATLPLAVWARAFDTTKTADPRSASTAASKTLTRLESKRLVRRARKGRSRSITVTLLRPDGSGAEYTRPDGNSDRFLKLDNRFWTDGWYEKLDLPATAMLLVSLHERPGFELATENMRPWYGFSPDTAERGLRTLRTLGIIDVQTRIKKAPLSPTGATRVNIYTLLPPFQVEQKPKRKRLRTLSNTTARAPRTAAAGKAQNRRSR